MARHRFLLRTGSLEGDELTLAGDEARHFSARRIRPGEQVVISDGRGRERTAELIAATGDGPRFRYVSAVKELEQERPRLTLVLGILKGDRLDWAVEKATELGVERIILLRSERVIADVSEARLSRLQRLMEGAAKQSQLARVPPIEDPTDIDGALAATTEGPRLVFWEESATEIASATAGIAQLDSASIWIGPEGGFGAVEVERMTAAGARVASLGPRPLRAETAALAALAICRQLGRARARE